MKKNVKKAPHHVVMEKVIAKKSHHVEKRHYLLRYFPLHCKGDYVKVALVAGGCDWKFEVCQFKDWPEFKPSTPQGKMPVLSINGGDWLDDTLDLIKLVCKHHGMWYDNVYDEKYGSMIGETIYNECFVNGYPILND